MSNQNFATQLRRGLIGLTRNFSSEAHRKSFLLVDSAHEAATKEFIEKHAKPDNILNGFTVVNKETLSQHLDKNSKTTDSAANIAREIVKGGRTIVPLRILDEVSDIVKFTSNQHNIKPLFKDATKKFVEELRKTPTNAPSR